MTREEAKNKLEGQVERQNLRECPFCGNAATLKPLDVFGAKWFYVKCDKCNAEINNPAPDKEEAVRVWNRRVNDGKDS